MSLLVRLFRTFAKLEAKCDSLQLIFLLSYGQLITVTENGEALKAVPLSW